MKKIFTCILSVLLVALSLTMFACKDKDAVSIKYAEADAIMQLLIEDKLDYGLLPEPAATKLEKVKGKDYTWHRISVQDLYDSQTKSYPQAVLMVKESILENYPQLVRSIESKFQENLTWVEQNPALAVGAVQGKYQTTSLAPAKVITKQVIDNCKISWQSAVDAKNAVNGYIADILNVGVGLDIPPAKTVADDFFYAGSSETGNIIENQTFSFVVPDGAPALAIAKFISDGQNFNEGATFNYNVVVANDIAKYMNGAIEFADFIILPVNAASKLYSSNQQNKYKMVSVITHGNLYIMSKNESSLSGLVNKTTGIIGKGNVPDLTFKSILSKNGINYKTVA